MITYLKKIVLGALSLIFLLFGIGQAQSSSDAYQTNVFNNLDQPIIDIRTSGGSINVVGHTEEIVRVEMYVKRGNRYLTPSDTDLEDFEIDISLEGNTVTASAIKESSGGWNWFRSNRTPSISFVLLVPEASTVEGRTSGGSMKAANLKNGVNLRTSGGSITLENATGNISLRTSGGSVTIADVSGDIDARTSGGSMRVENAFGNIQLRTSGGSIRIQNSGGKMSARTSGGSIRAELVELNDELNLRTSGGSITLNIPGPAPYDFDLRANRVNIDLIDFTGSTSRNSVSGSMMGGGAAIAARTSGGSVTVNFQ